MPFYKIQDMSSALIGPGGGNVVRVTRDNDQLGVGNLFLGLPDRFHGLDTAAVRRDNQGRSLDPGKDVKYPQLVKGSRNS